MCVCERERERERENKCVYDILHAREKARAQDRVTACVFTRTDALMHLCFAETMYRDKVIYQNVPGGTTLFANA